MGKSFSNINGWTKKMLCCVEAKDLSSREISSRTESLVQCSTTTELGEVIKLLLLDMVLKSHNDN